MIEYYNTEAGVKQAKQDLATLVTPEDFALFLTATEPTMSEHWGRTVYDIVEGAEATVRAHKLNHLSDFRVFVLFRYSKRVCEILDYLYGMNAQAI